MHEEKTDQGFENRRLIQECEQLQAQMQKLQSDTFKQNSEQHTSSATITRLQTQLTGLQQDMELVVNQKIELEKVIKSQKGEILEAENKSTEYYNQLLSTKENFQILHNEQKMLSEELTAKQKEMQKVERTKLD